MPPAQIPLSKQKTTEDYRIKKSSAFLSHVQADHFDHNRRQSQSNSSETHNITQTMNPSNESDVEQPLNYGYLSSHISQYKYDNDQQPVIRQFRLIPRRIKKQNVFKRLS